MPKQLNIFDVEPAICEFDVMKANVKRGTGRNTYADVRVQVPKNAKCTDELPRTTKQDDRYDIFEQYAMAIWRFQRAVDKFLVGIQQKSYVRQGIKEIIPVRVYLGSGFKPDVVEYMR